jgi:hypothetical protein
MVKIITQTVARLKARIHVTQPDIVIGECLRKDRCMHKVAIARTLMSQLKIKSDAELRVRVDAGHIRFNWRGWRWCADSPKIVQTTLKRFDGLAHEWSPAQRGRDPEGWRNAVLKVIRPHSYVIIARRMSRIAPVNRERQDQVNAARRARAHAGLPDKRYMHNTLHQRVVGF